MVVGGSIMEDNVKCAQEVEGWDLLDELRFIVQDVVIIKLGEGDLGDLHEGEDGGGCGGEPY